MASPQSLPESRAGVRIKSQNRNEARRAAARPINKEFEMFSLNNWLLFPCALRQHTTRTRTQMFRF